MSLTSIAARDWLHHDWPLLCVQFPQWYPLSIVKAGPAANALVRGLDTQWGKLLYGKTLVRTQDLIVIISSSQVLASPAALIGLLTLTLNCSSSHLSAINYICRAIVLRDVWVIHVQVRNIAKSVYRDKKQIEKSFKQQVGIGTVLTRCQLFAKPRRLHRGCS